MKAWALVAWGVCLGLALLSVCAGAIYSDYTDYDDDYGPDRDNIAMEAVGRVPKHKLKKVQRYVPKEDEVERLIDPEHPEFEHGKLTPSDLNWVLAETKRRKMVEEDARAHQQWLEEETRKAAMRPTQLSPDELIAAQSGMKATFVDFFAPWCGHCKKLDPVWDDVAEAVYLDRKLSQCVTIAKLDGDYYKQFGVEEEVKAFPTLKWYTAGVTGGQGMSKQKYNGGHDLESIMAYIHTQCSTRTGMRIFAFDVLASQFATAESEEAAHEVLASLQSAADRVPDGIQKPAAEMYLTVADDALKVGIYPTQRWLAVEQKRLEEKIATPTDVDLGDFNVDMAILRFQIITGFLNGPNTSWTHALS